MEGKIMKLNPLLLSSATRLLMMALPLSIVWVSVLLTN